MFSLIQLREKRQHFVRQILWSFIARPHLLSDHRTHGTTGNCFRPGYVIRFHSLIEDGNLSWAQSLLAPLMRS